jgi:octaprenyl-diphosphate synthase
MDYQQITQLINDDMQAVNELILQRLHSEVALVNQLGAYIINSGGKRLRPTLALLVARACGYSGQKHVDVAAIVEFIHTATLLHDDVVDESAMRRGKDTANNLWGNQAAVLVGDFLYSRSFEMMVDVNSMRVMEILSKTTNIIAEGEVLQLLNCHDPDTSEESYMAVIHSKTAKLFEAACQLGAVLADRPQEEELAMAKYGMHLGTAFQLIDDVLDYSSSAEEMGKNVGDDLAEGKPTLPLIVAMRNTEGENRQHIRKAIEEGGLEYLDSIMASIKSTNALDYTIEVAKKETELAVDALSCLPESHYKQALTALADISLQRTH